MNIPRLDIPRIVVIGCGFAGIKFVQKINSKKFQVVLLDKNNYHTFQPLMYQVATSGLEPDSITYPIRKVFKGKEHFHFRKTEVLGVNHSTKTVMTDIGDIQYDYLVVAMGAKNNFFGNSQFEQLTVPMKSLNESLDLRSMILQNFEDALNTQNIEEQNQLMNFVIVGGGATGVELAGALAELKDRILPKDYPDLDVRRMQIHLIEGSPRVLSAMSEKASKRSEQFLRKMGVNVWLKTRVKSYDGTTVVTDAGMFHAKSVIWTAGVKAVSLDGIDLTNSVGGRIPVNELNESLNQSGVYALGDIAEMVSEEYPRGHAMLASVAGQQGAWLAKNLNRKANNKEMKPFVYNDKGTMATVGRNKAVVDLKKMTFGGFFAWLTWMFVHLMLLVEFRNRLVVFANWAWRYIKYDRASRLIIREYHRKTMQSDEHHKRTDSVA